MYILLFEDHEKNLGKALLHPQSRQLQKIIINTIIYYSNVLK